MRVLDLVSYIGFDLISFEFRVYDDYVVSDIGFLGIRRLFFRVLSFLGRLFCFILECLVCRFL